MKNLHFTSKSLLLLCLYGIAFQLIAQPNYPTNVQDAELITSDLEHFIGAHNKLKPGVDTINILNENYFSKATPGLTEYIQRHGLTPGLLKEAIKNNPDVYHNVAAFYQKIDELDPLFRNALTKYQTIIPDAIFAPTYLIVGANRGIGQASRYGQLITITRLLDDPDKLIKMIIHELTHFQQAMALGPQNYGALYSKKDNMLGLCLREGGAEFITFLVLNDITQSQPLQYYIDNKEVLDQRFLKDLENQNPSYWLWDSIGKDKDQQLMGYVMGFKICQSLYDKSLDKELALKEILSISEAEAFLSKSGYFNLPGKPGLTK